MSRHMPPPSHPERYGQSYQQQQSGPQRPSQRWNSDPSGPPVNLQNPSQQLRHGPPPQNQSYAIPVLVTSENGPQSEPSHTQRDPHDQSPPELARPYLDTCFNCGDPDHWASRCPEPRRASPHGYTRNFQTQSTGPQQQTYMPPVITRYPVPPHAQQGYTPSPISTGYPMYPQPYGQPPPPPANSPHGPPFWERGPAYPPHPMPPPFQLGSGPPPHSQGYGPFYPQEQHLPGQWSYTLHPGHQGYSSNFHPSTFPVGMSSTAQGQHAANYDPSASTGYYTLMIDPAEHGDLGSLEVPDVPTQNAELFGNKRPQLVKVPLPAISESDEIGAIHPYPPDEDGNVRSAFVGSNPPDLLNIKHSKEFKLYADDPIFMSIGSLASRDDVQQAHDKPSKSRASSSTPAVSQKDPKRTDALKRKRTPGNTFEGSHRDARQRRSPLHGSEEGEIVGSPGALSVESKDLGRPPSTKTSHQRRPPYDATHAPPPPPGSPPREQRYNDAYWSGQNRNMGSSSILRQSSDNRRHQNKENYEGNSNKRQRQEDDVVPKHRRNDPEVPDAYSRRW